MYPLDDTFPSTPLTPGPKNGLRICLDANTLFDLAGLAPDDAVLALIRFDHRGHSRVFFAVMTGAGAVVAHNSAEPCADAPATSVLAEAAVQAATREDLREAVRVVSSARAHRLLVGTLDARTSVGDFTAGLVSSWTVDSQDTRQALNASVASGEVLASVRLDVVDAHFAALSDAARRLDNPQPLQAVAAAWRLPRE